MLDKIFLALISIVPTLSILIFFIYSDKFVEPKKNIFLAFIMGIFIIAPLEVVHYLSVIFFGKTPEYSNFSKAFINIAFLEELFKFCILIFFCKKFIEFDEPMDGIVYGITVSLGFAFWENLQYIYIYNNPTIEKSITISWFRTFTAFPSHAMHGIIMGFFIGKKFFSKTKTNLYLYLAVLIPVILHGFYDWILMNENLNNNLIYLIIVFELILVIILYRDIRSKQLLKNKEKEKRFF